MRGTEVSEADLRLAQEFLEHISHAPCTDDDQLISITRTKLIRLVAWYGAIRANGDHRGHLISNGKPLRKPSPKDPTT